MSNLRFDRGEIKNKHYTDEGFLRVDAIVTRTGVFDYRNDDGSLRRELRHPDDVLKEDSLTSMEMIPITLNHPKEVLVNADNYKKLSVGTVGQKISHDGNTIKANVLITDKQAIKAVESGIQEVSLGYKTTLVEEAGDYNGERHDFRQTDIQYNHLAIVPRGRAGVAKLVLDAGDAIQHIKTETKGETMSEMVKVSLDSIQYEASQEVANHLSRETSRADKAEKEKASLKADKDKLQAKLDEAQEKVQSLEKVDHADTINKAVKARITLVKAALDHLEANEAEGIELKADSEIKEAVIKKYRPDVNLDGKSEDYIQACFDGALENEPKKAVNSDSVAKQRKASKLDSSESVKTDAQSSREAMIKSMQEAYKGDK